MMNINNIMMMVMIIGFDYDDDVDDDNGLLCTRPYSCNLIRAHTHTYNLHIMISMFVYNIFSFSYIKKKKN